MKLLSVVILGSNRYDLLGATINSLFATMTYKNWEMKIINNQGSIGEGWNKMIENIKGDYVLMCQDDWFFIEKWDWVEASMDFLEKRDDIGIIRLRKEGDGQCEERLLEVINNGQHNFNIVDCIGGGFSMNPFICKKELLERLGSTVKLIKQKGVAEVDVRERYAQLGLKTAKLANNAKGVCIHIGRGRRVSK